MPPLNFSIRVLRDEYAIARLSPDLDPIDWIRGEFTSLTRTAAESSVVCLAEAVPEDVHHDRGWRCLHVDAVMDFSLLGVLAHFCGLLSEAGVSVFACSTFDTDYLLVRESQIEVACRALAGAGHELQRDDDQ